MARTTPLTSGLCSGKNLVITGCTAGIGEAAALQLAPLGCANLMLLNRSREKTESLVKDLTLLAGNTKIHTVIADLGEPDQVRRAVDEIKDILGEEALHFLVSNAGIWLGDKKKYAQCKTTPLTNSKGHEIHFATNYLSMVILCQGLQTCLEKASDSGQLGRVIITGSFTTWEMSKGSIQWDNLDGTGKKGCGTSPMMNTIMYPQSKLCQHMWARDFAQKVAGKIHVIVWCPGAVETNIDAWATIKKMFPCTCCFYCLLKPRNSDMAANIARVLCDEISAEDLDRVQNELNGGEAGIYCDCNKNGMPKTENILAGLNLGNNKKGLMSKLEEYPTYGWKFAPDTKNWDAVNKTVSETESRLHPEQNGVRDGIEVADVN